MQFEPGDPWLGYDIFVCNNCDTKILLYRPTPDNEDDD